MSHTILAVIGLIGLFLILTATIFTSRTLLIVKGKKRANDFKTDGTDVSPFSNRLSRVHANLYESALWLAGPLLLAISTQTTHITDSLALVLLAARVIQSAIHLASTSVQAVQLRFTFFFIQFLISSYWLILFAQHWL